MRELIHALDRLIALAFFTCAVLLVILANMIAMNVRLHAINAKLAAFNSQFTAISGTLER